MIMAACGIRGARILHARDAGSGQHQTVVVTMTVKVHSYNETQTFLFYPRLNP